MSPPGFTGRGRNHPFFLLALIPLLAGGGIYFAVQSNFNRYREQLQNRMESTSLLQGQLIAEQIRGRLSSLDLLLLMLESRSQRYNLSGGEGVDSFYRYIQNRASFLTPATRIFILSGEGNLEYCTDTPGCSKREALIAEIVKRHREELLSFSVLPWRGSNGSSLILSRRLDYPDGSLRLILAAEISEALLFEEADYTDSMVLLSGSLYDGDGRIVASWLRGEDSAGSELSPEDLGASDGVKGLKGGSYSVCDGQYVSTLIQIKDFSFFLGLHSDISPQLESWKGEKRRALNFILYASLSLSLFTLIVIGLNREKNRVRAHIMEELEQKVEERTAELNSALREIKRMARLDPLTGVLNRRGMIKILEQEMARTRRYGGTFALAMCDIDYFKRINDTLGHTVGDGALCFVVDRIGGLLRNTDSLSRWGGEEFLILFSQIDQAQALAAAEKLRRSFEENPWRPDYTVTCSFGVATLGEGEDYNDLIRRADEALFRAKESRNAVGE